MDAWCQPQLHDVFHSEPLVYKYTGRTRLFCSRCFLSSSASTFSSILSKSNSNTFFFTQSFIEHQLFFLFFFKMQFSTAFVVLASAASLVAGATLGERQNRPTLDPGRTPESYVCGFQNLSLIETARSGLLEPSC